MLKDHHHKPYTMWGCTNLAKSEPGVLALIDKNGNISQLIPARNIREELEFRLRESPNDAVAFMQEAHSHPHERCAELSRERADRQRLRKSQ